MLLYKINLETTGDLNQDLLVVRTVGYYGPFVPRGVMVDHEPDRMIEIRRDSTACLGRIRPGHSPGHSLVITREKIMLARD